MVNLITPGDLVQGCRLEREVEVVPWGQGGSYWG